MEEYSCFETHMPTISFELAKATAQHPCYSFNAQHKFARMHLPVASGCNVSCNYCNRKYDCVNESRPGVTSKVLTPEHALERFVDIKEKMPNLKVVGIAGPGDALANWESVKKTIELIKKQCPEIILCLSTNGLLLPRYSDDIIELGIKHVTVTVNCLDHAIGAKIYHHIYYENSFYKGEEGAKILINNQLAGINIMANNGIIVKVNIVMMKDINAEHIPVVVKKVKELGAVMTNIMPLIPVQGSEFQYFPKNGIKEVNAMRDLCQIDLAQMRHCQQCRADAVGLLTDDKFHDFQKRDCGRKS